MDDQMKDASLDRDIESMLAVDPSPEFLARVRTRVAAEPEPSRWRGAWMFATAGAVAVAIVAVMVWPSREAVAPNITSMQSRPAAAAVEATIAVAAVPARGTGIDLPEVVVAEDEVKAFAALVAAISRSGFDVPLPVAPDPDAPVEVTRIGEWSPVVIEPIEIEPVTVSTLE